MSGIGARRASRHPSCTFRNLLPFLPCRLLRAASKQSSGRGEDDTMTPRTLIVERSSRGGWRTRWRILKRMGSAHGVEGHGVGVGVPAQRSRLVRGLSTGCMLYPKNSTAAPFGPYAAAKSEIWLSVHCLRTSLVQALGHGMRHTLGGLVVLEPHALMGHKLSCRNVH